MKKSEILLLIFFATLVMVLAPLSATRNAVRSLPVSATRTAEECDMVTVENEEEIIECTKINEKPVHCDGDDDSICVIE